MLKYYTLSVPQTEFQTESRANIMIIFLYFRKLFYIHIKLFKEIQQEFKTSE